MKQIPDGAGRQGMVEFFVSPRGHDGWSGRAPRGVPGTRTGPLATLDGARAAVRKFKARHGVPADGIRVWIEPGIYEIARTVDLAPEDSGAAHAPIVYAASRPGTAVFRGGKVLKEFGPVADPAVLERLPAAARRHVVQADLRAQGVRDFGTLQSRGFGRRVVPAALELFFDGRPMTLARWPNVDYVRITDIPAQASQRDGWGGRVAKGSEGFIFASDRLRRWKWPQDIWIHGYWCWDWANSYERVARLDPASGRIRTAAPHSIYGYRQGQRFFFQNILEELDTPGEWYLDRDSGILYFWPPGPLRPGSAVVSLLETPMVSLDGASHVAFEGLVFEACRAQAIAIRGGLRNRITGCTLRNTGNYAATIDGGGHHRVDACEIACTGDGGVELKGGDRGQLTGCHHAVENCHIHHFSRWSKCYCPAIQATGVAMTFRHNRIHDAPHTAILFCGNEFTIADNEIYQVCLETGDAGAIYTGRDYTYRGNVVRGNFIHHMGGVGMGTMGVYNDDCVSGTAMIGNIFYRATRAVMLGGGRDFVVENNLFVDCRPAIHFDSRGISPHPNWQKMVNETMRRRLADMDYLKPPYAVRYPELRPLERYMKRGEGVPPEHTFVRRNICLGGVWMNIDDGAKRYLKAERNYVAPDRLPAVTPDLVFRLPTEALRAADFRPISAKAIGLQTTAARTCVPPRALVTAFLEILPPSRGGGASRARVTVRNHGQVRASGLVCFTLQAPDGAAAFSPPAPLRYGLEPGQARVHRFRVGSACLPAGARLSWYFPGDTCFRQTGVAGTARAP